MKVKARDHVAIRTNKTYLYFCLQTDRQRQKRITKKLNSMLYSLCFSSKLYLTSRDITTVFSFGFLVFILYRLSLSQTLLFTLLYFTSSRFSAYFLSLQILAFLSTLVKIVFIVSLRTLFPISLSLYVRIYTKSRADKTNSAQSIVSQRSTHKNRVLALFPSTLTLRYCTQFFLSCWFSCKLGPTSL